MAYVLLIFYLSHFKRVDVFSCAQISSRFWIRESFNRFDADPVLLLHTLPSHQSSAGIAMISVIL